MSDPFVDEALTVKVLRQQMQVMNLNDIGDDVAMMNDDDQNVQQQPAAGSLSTGDQEHEQFPYDDRFFETFENLVNIEFQHRDVSVHDALYEMWVAHVYQVGSNCDETCPCFDFLGELSCSVYYANSRTMNFLSCFLPKFLPRLKKEYPLESRQQLCRRLERMWHRHSAVAIEPTIKTMQLPCSYESCQCSDYWDSFFNLGDPSPCYAISIHEEMDSMSVFRTKFSSLVSAEFTITEFPDVINFALGRMWQQHLCLIGEECDAACPCWKDISTLGGTVLQEMLARKEAFDWENPKQFEADSVPTGALLCYAKTDTLGAAVSAGLQDIQALDNFLASWPAATGEKCRPDCRCRL